MGVSLFAAGEKREVGRTYVVEFRTASGEALAISNPRTETAVIRHFQERMPYGLLFVRNIWRARVFPKRSPRWRTSRAAIAASRVARGLTAVGEIYFRRQLLVNRTRACGLFGRVRLSEN